MRERLSGLIVVKSGSSVTDILNALASLTVTTIEYACLMASGILLLADLVSADSHFGQIDQVVWVSVTSD